MGFASGSEFIGPVLDYADKYELWTDKNVIKIVELLALALFDHDWDTEDECYDSKTFRRCVINQKINILKEQQKI